MVVRPLDETLSVTSLLGAALSYPVFARSASSILLGTRVASFLAHSLSDGLRLSCLCLDGGIYTQYDTTPTAAVVISSVLKRRCHQDTLACQPRDSSLCIRGAQTLSYSVCMYIVVALCTKLARSRPACPESGKT